MSLPAGMDFLLAMLLPIWPTGLSIAAIVISVFGSTRH